MSPSPAPCPEPKRPHCPVLAAIAWLVLAAALPALVRAAPSPGAVGPGTAGPAAAAGALVPRHRYGFVSISGQWPDKYDVSPLHAGWFVDYSQPACRAAPEGMTPALGIRTPAGYTIPSSLATVVDNHPGAIWLIGNEPDCINQDDLYAAEYAAVYHDLYNFIKGRDPTAQIAAGNIVQPTPIRLAYLDAVLAAYQAAHGTTMPVDVWAIHNMILNEIPGSWGADIPEGMDPSLAVTREISDNDSMTIFTDQVWDFRRWMAANGYGGLPLIISEYGILMPEALGFSAARVNAFMSATFQFLSTATDPALGDPSDGNRLVQRWVWYSLDDRFWTPADQRGFNGNLFNPDTRQITAFGQHFGSLTAALPELSYADLVSCGAGAPAPRSATDPTDTLTLTLLVEVKNTGTAAAGSSLLAVAYQGPRSGTLEQVVGSVPARSSRRVELVIRDLPPGAYAVSGTIDAGRQAPESVECNNAIAGRFLVPAYRTMLADVGRNDGGQAGQLERVLQLSDRPSTLPAQALQPSNLTAFQTWTLPSPNSGPAQVVVDPATGYAWFTEQGAAKIGRIDPAGGVVEPLSLPAGSEPYGLALDDTGRLWFAESGADRIGWYHVQTQDSGACEVPTTGSQPSDVSVAANGIVWFTERAANKIGRLDPATCAVKEYNLLPGARPGGLTTRYVNDGLTYVWFVETGANRLARLRWTPTTTPTISGPAIPTPNSAPQDTVLDYGANPWLTEEQGNQIAMFQPQTQQDYFEYPVPTAASEPFGIAAGPGGWPIWFTERAANKLGRYHQKPGFWEFTLPEPGGQPTGIAVDGSGCAWYTAPGTNQVGRLCVVSHLTQLPYVTRNHVP